MKDKLIAIESEIHAVHAQEGASARFHELVEKYENVRCCEAVEKEWDNLPHTN